MAVLQSDQSPHRPMISPPPRRDPTLRDHIDEWAAGRNWAVRLPLLLYFAYVFYRHSQNPFYASFMAGLNLALHELGHYLWAPFGQDWAVLGGSLTQCLLPVVAVAMFSRQRDFFAIAIGCCWLGVNLFEVATYAADALTQQLQLVSPGSADPAHDWGYILGRWNKLSKAREVGAQFRLAGAVAFVVGLGLGAWVLTRMRALKQRK